MSFEVDIVVSLRLPETAQGGQILQALRKLHAPKPDPSALEQLKALPAPAGSRFATALGGEPAARFRLFDFVSRGAQTAFSMVLPADMLERAFPQLLIAFEEAGCRRIEATAKADDLARSYTCADGDVEYTTEREGAEFGDEGDDAGGDDE